MRQKERQEFLSFRRKRAALSKLESEGARPKRILQCCKVFFSCFCAAAASPSAVFSTFPSGRFLQRRPKKILFGDYFLSVVRFPPSFPCALLFPLSFSIAFFRDFFSVFRSSWECGKSEKGEGEEKGLQRRPSLLHQSRSNSKRDSQRRREDPLCRLRCLDSRAVKALLCPPSEAPRRGHPSEPNAERGDSPCK